MALTEKQIQQAKTSGSKIKLDWLEEHDVDEYKQIMDEVHLQVEDNKRNNGIEKVREDEAMQKHVARLARRNTA